MRKNVLICLFAAVCLTLGGICIADSGPDDMILQAEKDKAKKPKPAVFPHKAHQEFAECGDCHHQVDDAGNKIPYEEGQEIGKCEDCHYKGSDMPKGLDSYKNAAHKNCKGCHNEVKKERPELEEKFAKCMPCHPKK